MKRYMKSYELIPLGFVLVMAGVFLIIAGMLSQAKASDASVKGGGIIMIGPLPIIFGTDAQSVKIVIALAILLILIAYVLLR